MHHLPMTLTPESVLKDTLSCCSTALSTGRHPSRRRSLRALQKLKSSPFLQLARKPSGGRDSSILFISRQDTKFLFNATTCKLYVHSLLTILSSLRSYAMLISIGIGYARKFRASGSAFIGHQLRPFWQTDSPSFCHPSAIGSL